jgi:hypothetical protein
MFDGLGKALAIVSAFGLASAGAIGFGASYLFEDDVSFDFNRSTELAIEEDTLSPRQVCAEFMKAQEAVTQEFTDRGVQLPTDTAMTLDECQLRMSVGALIARP